MCTKREHPMTDAFPTYLSRAALPFSSRDVFSLRGQGVEQPTVSKTFLESHSSHLQCGYCSADLCLTSQIISKGFTGRHGRAYLVSAPATTETKSAGTSYSLPNTKEQKAVPRQLVTGEHTVSDICCRQCGSMLGWKYVAAEEESQRYKVGKFILETKRINRSSCWENHADEDIAPRDISDVDDMEDIEFDSQNEDECDDIFSGVWSPSLALERRANDY